MMDRYYYLENRAPDIYGRFQRGFPDKGRQLPNNDTPGFPKQPLYLMLAVFVAATVAVSIALSVTYGTGQSSASTATTTTTSTNYGANVEFQTDFSNQLYDKSSSTFKAMKESTCQQMQQIFSAYLNPYYKSCSVYNFSQGSVIANFRFVFDFGAADSIYGSQQIRQTIQDGARNTAGLKYPINTNTVTVNAQWSSAKPNVCELTKPCDHICRPVSDASYVCSCSSGYSLVGGTRCVALDACSSQPCFNYGVCATVGSSNFTCVCPPPYTGKDCSQVINYCASNPCLNQANCTSHATSYSCLCPAGYYGSRCESTINYCTNSPCVNGGNCTNSITGYTCTCPAGYTDVNCQSVITHLYQCTSTSCANNGTCIADATGNFKCACACGFTGITCETAINYCASSPCVNGGNCTNSHTGYTCSCPADFTGVNCQSVITRLYQCTNTSCANNGTCIADATGNFTCSCACGFTGITCQTDIDECASAPCMNAATCVNLVNGYACQCSSSFLGQHCEININTCASNPCQNGGTCWNGANTFTCECSIAYTGLQCETLVPEIFCAALTSNRTLPYSTINNYDVITAQRRRTFDASKGIYTPVTNGTYVLHMSAGTLGATYADMYIVWNNGNAELEARTDTTPNGTETSSRDYIAHVEPSDLIYMTLGGNVYNDQMKQTSMSAFRLEDAMSTVVAFAAAYSGFSSPGVGTTLIYSTIDVNVGTAFNETTGGFVAPQDGVYVFSVSILAYESYKSTIGFNVNGIQTYELIMNATHLSDDYPFSRSVALQLTAGTNVTLSLVADRLSGGSSDRETSFIGWLYNPKPAIPTVIWSVHRTTSLTGASSPVIFDNTGVSLGGAWNANTNIVTIPVSGIYQIHMTATCAISGTVNFQLMWNNVAYANIYGTSTNLDGVIMKSRAIMIDAKANDTLFIATDSTTSLYSNSMKLISFTGFLLAR